MSQGEEVDDGVTRFIHQGVMKKTWEVQPMVELSRAVFGTHWRIVHDRRALPKVCMVCPEDHRVIGIDMKGFSS